MYLNCMKSDIEILTELNDSYIRSVQASDATRFDKVLLAPDFYCSHPDGTLADRPTFLKQTAAPVAIRDLASHDVMIRVLGDMAIIHARTSWTKPDGTPGRGRYTDIWARRDGGWKAVAAHVTRVP